MSIIDVLSGTWRPGAYTAMGRDDVAPGAPFTPVQELPDGILQFLLPSRYCQSDRLGEQAQQITAGLTPGFFVSSCQFFH